MFNGLVKPCMYNIDQGGRNARMRGGLFLFAAGLALAVGLVKSGLPIGYRALVFAPFMAASVMVFQAAYRTCLFNAMRHCRETNRGLERVASPEQIEADQARARMVLRMSAAIALLTTGVLFLLP